MPATMKRTNEKPLNRDLGVYPLILRAPDGREQHTLVWFPNEAVRRDFYNRAHKNGLEVIMNEND